MTGLRWGIVGPGEIAAVFAESLAASGVGEIVGAFGRDAARTREFCAAHGGTVATTLDQLVADPNVEAIYVASPHPAHAFAVRCALEADRAVLCEKPMTVSPATTRALCELAESRGVVLAEAWMYRCHPQIARLSELVRGGTLGTPQRLRAWFGFAAPFDPTSRLYSAELGGGAILDIGGYPLSLATCLSGNVEPRIVRTAGSLASTGVDENAEIELDLGDGFVADLSVSIGQASGCGAVIDCSRGRIVVDDPFLPGGERHGLRAKFRIEPDAGAAREEVLESDHDCFALEAAAMTELVRSGAATFPPPSTPLVSHAESIALAHLQHTWRERVGAAPVTDS